MTKMLIVKTDIHGSPSIVENEGEVICEMDLSHLTALEAAEVATRICHAANMHRDLVDVLTLAFAGFETAVRMGYAGPATLNQMRDVLAREQAFREEHP